MHFSAYNAVGPPHIYASVAEVAIGICFIALYVLTARSQKTISRKVKKELLTVADCILCILVGANGQGWG